MAIDKEQQRRPTAEDLSTMPRWRRRDLAVWGTRRSRLGAVVGMIGGGLVALGTFLPWLNINGKVLSGWDIYDLRSTAGENPFVIHPMFGRGAEEVDFFFTGLVTLLLGVLSVLFMTIPLIAHTKAPPKTFKVRLALFAPAAVTTAAAFVITTTNLVFASANSSWNYADSLTSVSYGLWVTWVGGLAAAFGMSECHRRKTRRAQERWEREIITAQEHPSGRAPTSPTP